MLTFIIIQINAVNTYIVSKYSSALCYHVCYLWRSEYVWRLKVLFMSVRRGIYQTQ